MKLTQTLKEIGFSEKEAKVYLQLIYLGPQSASVLSRHTKINRTSTYDALDSLKKRGIVRLIKKKGSTRFQGLHPSELIRFLEREKSEAVAKLERQQTKIGEVLPELISLQNTGTNKPMVTFYEGEKGMREAYEDTLNAKGDILAFANIEEMHAGLPHLFPEYYKRRGAGKGIHIKAIFPDNALSVERSKRDLEENRETLLISADDFSFTPEVNIYNDKTLITSWKEQLSILIQSEEIADFHRKIFKMCWEKTQLKCKCNSIDI